MAKSKNSTSRQGPENVPRIEPDHHYSVVFSAPAYSDLEPLLTVSGVDVGCRHPAFRPGATGVQVCVLVAGRVLPQLLLHKGWKAHIVADQTLRGGEALAFVGKGNRFRRAGALPQGAGRLIPAADAGEEASE